jgi:hypothetical protein
MVIVSSQEAYNILSQSKGKIFSAIFIKKDGTVREMNCRTGVKKYLRGGSLSYNPSDYLNIPVFDLVKKAYRTIKCDNLISFKLEGKMYKVVNTNVKTSSISS